MFRDLVKMFKNNPETIKAEGYQKVEDAGTPESLSTVKSV